MVRMAGWRGSSPAGVADCRIDVDEFDVDVAGEGGAADGVAARSPDHGGGDVVESDWVLGRMVSVRTAGVAVASGS
jgi:hypothetical protein